MSKVTENFELYLKATESAAIAAAKLEEMVMEKLQIKLQLKL